MSAVRRKRQHRELDEDVDAVAVKIMGMAAAVGMVVEAKAVARVMKGKALAKLIQVMVAGRVVTRALACR